MFAIFKALFGSNAEKFAKGGLTRSQKEYNKEVDAYKWFIINTESKRAESGWEHKEDALEALKDYDGDKNYKVVAESSLGKYGIGNPKGKWKEIPDMEHGGRVGGRYNTGRSWHADRRQVSKEDYEQRHCKDKNKKADGGKVNIVNEGVDFSKKKYEGIFGDYDKDGIPNADDPNPRRKGDHQTVEDLELSKMMGKLLGIKGDLDHTMTSAVKDIVHLSPRTSAIYARTKTPYSIINKLIDKRLIVPKEPKKGLTDVIGTTIAVDNYNDLVKVRKQIESGALGDVFEIEDFYEKPLDGYRAVHYIVMYQNGDGKFPVEVQLKTKRMKAVNQLSHGAYKAKDLNKERLEYVTGLVADADKGNKKALAEFDKLFADPDALMASFYKSGAPKKEEGGRVDEDWRELDQDFIRSRKFKTNKQ